MKYTIPLCVAMALSASVAQAQTYHLTALGNNADVSAINDLGQVVGTNYFSISDTPLTNPVAYLWSNGQSTVLGHGIQSASDINNLGQITGGLSYDQNATHAYLYSGGVVKDLDPHGINSAGLAINNHGVVAGYCSPSDAHVNQGAATFSNGRVNDLGVAAGVSGYSSAFAINDKGQVAGAGGDSCGGRNCAFVYSGGNVSYIMPLGGHDETFANGINSAGIVVGASEVTRGIDYPTHAITFSNGAVKDLTPSASASYASFANAINDAGAIVGTDSSGAFLYSGGKTHNLGSMLDSSGKGWTLSTAIDINNLGQIVGEGIDGQGNHRAFLLAPVPEPATWASMLAGLAVVASVARRKRKAADRA